MTRTPLRRWLVAYVALHPGCTAADIAVALDVTVAQEGAVRDAIRRALRAGLLAGETRAPTPPGRPARGLHVTVAGIDLLAGVDPAEVPLPLSHLERIAAAQVPT